MRDATLARAAERLSCADWIFVYLLSREEIHAANNDAPIVLSRRHLEKFYEGANIRRTLYDMRRMGVIAVDGNSIMMGKEMLNGG